MGTLPTPVHLYVKVHRRTGLKYFGRTTLDPRTYMGSGAYWLRHLEKYGNDVATTVIGTNHDEGRLRAAAKSFSSRHDIARSTEWANLLHEDGGIAGAGYNPLNSHADQVAALDAAVQRRLLGGEVGQKSSTGSNVPWAPIAVIIAIVIFVIANYAGTSSNNRRTVTSTPTPSYDPRNSADCRLAMAEAQRAEDAAYQAWDIDDNQDGRVDDPDYAQHLQEIAYDAQNEVYRYCY